MNKTVLVKLSLQSCSKINTFRGGSRTAATCKVELFVIIVNSRKPLTNITKSSTLDVAAVPDSFMTFALGKYELG